MSAGIMTAAINALSNSSRAPIEERQAEHQVLSILTTGDGPGHLVRALFGDCSFETLDRIGAEHDVSRATIRRAYAYARLRHAALNDELDRSEGDDAF